METVTKKNRENNKLVLQVQISTIQPLDENTLDLLGRANQRMASRADKVYFLVAGMAIPLHEIALKL